MNMMELIGQQEEPFQQELIELKEQGVELAMEVDEDTSGPGSFLAIDPDGNPILVDQHV